MSDGLVATDQLIAPPDTKMAARSEDDWAYGEAPEHPAGPSRRAQTQDVFRDEEVEEDSFEEEEGFEMSVAELLYSTSAFYSILVPVTITMVLSAWAVVNINTEESREQGAAQMAEAYQVWQIDDSDSSVWMNILMSLANSLIMVCVICMMTFGVVLLYRYECMKCLIGYMMFCSTSLLGFLGGHMWYMAIEIYRIPVDKPSFYLGLWNFAVVGILAIFFGRGVPKWVTQGYLVLTSVILAWHLDFFDEYTTWALLFMLALYDLCAVLTPCGPLKALVNLMSQDNAPEMPGLLYEADLPAEARRPGGAKPKKKQEAAQNTPSDQSHSSVGEGSGVWDNRSVDSVPRIEIPLAVARVYNLPVLAIPRRCERIFDTQPTDASGRPLLRDDYSDGPRMPDIPTPTQLKADVVVKLPAQGGRIEKIDRRGKTIYLEKDRFGKSKRVLWVDQLGRVFAETAEDFLEDEGEEKNTIRLGLGDFIFYSVLVGKAAQYSFTTFAACMLVILTGLGGTLVLLSVFHHALPALPISICLGIFFYVVTRIFVEPWVEAVLVKPYYV